MTRKRFVKLLMARGETRNDANRIAAVLRSCFETYKGYVKTVYWDVDQILNEYWQNREG